MTKRNYSYFIGNLSWRKNFAPLRSNDFLWFLKEYILSFKSSRRVSSFKEAMWKSQKFSLCKHDLSTCRIAYLWAPCPSHEILNQNFKAKWNANAKTVVSKIGFFSVLWYRRANTGIKTWQHNYNNLFSYLWDRIRSIFSGVGKLENPVLPMGLDSSQATLKVTSEL